MNGIVADVNPQELHVVWCDAAINRVDSLEEADDLVGLHKQINDDGGTGGAEAPTSGRCSTG